MNKGEQTRSAIVATAVDLASVQGLDGLSIGQLAARTGMSKSGLFAHFGSKQALQLAVLEDVAEQFVAEVLRPALKVPAGLGRLQALFDRWLDWATAEAFPGGCPLVGATMELDDRPGPLRDYLAAAQGTWLGSIARVVQGCVDRGEFAADVDPDQFAFELNGIYLAHHFSKRLLRESGVATRARAAFDHLVARSRA
ncbi:MAG: TetR/AcrR family transcriptional regulator [Chromatiales bacterium]|nr:TetR/AcrR family transcriptional regulator [Chromatiales bacterium]